MLFRSLLRIGEAEAAAAALLLECWEVGSFRKEVPVGSVEVFQRLLQGVEGRFRAPRRVCIAAPGAEVLSHRLVANVSFTRFSICDLQAQSHVEHSAAPAREAIHAPLLPGVWAHLVLKGLLDLHYANS